MSSLLGLLRQEGDKIVSVLALLEATECHFGAGDVLLRVLEVLKLHAPMLARLKNGSMAT